MPRGRKDSEKLLEEIEQVEQIQTIGERKSSATLEAKEKKRKKDKVKEIAKKNRTYTILYVVSCVAFFLLALLVIALINLATGDGFTL